MAQGLRLITPPSGRVVSLEQARHHCRVTHDEEDALLEAYSEAAERRCEDITGRQLLTATWEQVLDGWPSGGVIKVPRPNLRSVVSISYIDPRGDLQVLDPGDYRVDAFSGPTAGHGRISLPYGKSWPEVLGQLGVITLRFEAGYGDPEDVPAPIVQGILLMVGTFYLQREELASVQVQVAPLAARNLWRPYWVR